MSEEKKFEPRIKADKQVEYENEKGIKEKLMFTHFEELMKRVEVLQDVVDGQADILRQNNLVYTDKIVAPSFDEDEVYKKLEEEE